LALALCADARRIESEVAMDIAAQIGASARAVSRINTAAAELRARAGSNVKGYLCKTIFQTDAHSFPYSGRFMSSKYGDWIPTTSKSVSIFLQGEASAKAFVGISAGVGVGLDMTVGTGKTITGQVRLFACIGASISVGYIGATASVGGGVLVGFGTFKDSIVAANVEIGADVAALGSGGIGVLLDVQGAVKAFQTEWNKHTLTTLGPVTKDKAYAQKCWNFFKSLAKAGGKAMAQGTVALVKGIHVSGGVGVGGGIGASAEVDLNAIIDGVKTGFQALWNGRAGAWLKNTKVWGTMKDKLAKIGKTKFGQKWKAFKAGAGKFVRGAVDDTNQFFDYVPLTDKD